MSYYPSMLPHRSSFVTFVVFLLKELSKQARTIMGNVDFFGSPLGFYQDVRGGLKEAINEKNPLTLVKSFTHGASNSAAKLTGSLSDTLRSITNFEDSDTALVVAPPMASGGDHFFGGLRGLSRGIAGGLTGLIVHPYQVNVVISVVN